MYMYINSKVFLCEKFYFVNILLQKKYFGDWRLCILFYYGIVEEVSLFSFQ